jgi:MFS family permease
VALPALCALANLLTKPVADGHHLTQRRWFPPALFAFWLAGTAIHLYCLGYVYDFDLSRHLVAPALWVLVIARATQGLGAAVMMALTMAFVGETIPKEKTGSAMGLLGTMSAVGTALGPSLGGVLIEGLGWRAIFYFITVASLSVAVLIAL